MELEFSKKKPKVKILRKSKSTSKEDLLASIMNSLNLAQEVAKIGSWDYDIQSDSAYWSDQMYKILGIKDKDTFVPNYQNALKFIVPEDRVIFEYYMQRAMKYGTSAEHQYRVRRQDNMLVVVRQRTEAKRDDKGNINRLVGILQDISDQLLTENKLKESQEKFQKIANNLDVGIWSMDFISKEIVYGSPGLERFLGFPVSQFLSGEKIWLDMIHGEDIEEYLSNQIELLSGNMLHQQYRIVTAAGEVKWVEDKTFPTINSHGELVRLDGIVQDISDRKRYEEKINYFAYYDHLTEIPNRRRFDITLEGLISNNSKSFALMYLDLDRFKFVNDTLGHEIGDKLLYEVAKRLTDLVKDKEYVFRIGGDEFAIIYHKMEDHLELGNNIIKKIEETFNIEGYDINISTSVGIGIFPNDSNSLKELKMNTDAALYRAKELGKNNFQLYTKSLNSESYKLFTLENDLRKAIQKAEFILHYQPRVNSFTGKIVGAEALIRWNHPKWGLVSPVDFIPLAEKTGLINDIGDWVIQQVCRQLKEWKQKGYYIVPISINLSAKTIMKSDLVSTLMNNLSKNGIDPNLLEIEITEESFIQNEASVLSTIQSLKGFGISISIDDFGTGYSSIGYLKKFNVDFIKIDRTFINGMLSNKGDSSIVQAIILLAKGFDLQIVAEGVETEEQWGFLKEIHCHFIQGYLFSKPLPVHKFTTLIKTTSIIDIK